MDGGFANHEDIEKVHKDHKVKVDAPVKDEAKKQLPKFLANGSAEQKAEFAKTHQLPAPWGHEVLAHGISTAFIPAAAMAALALATAWPPADSGRPAAARHPRGRRRLLVLAVARPPPVRLRRA